ncbi:MAG: universal stress protein [Hormoscilla sp. GUM202]|nr:universal stress protein [Hormoscilla sp. GUM202]
MSLFTLDRVLVPIDFSEASFNAVAETRAFVRDASHLYILHVLHPLHQGEPGVIWQTVNNETRKQHVEQAFYQRCQAPEYQGVHFSVLVGNPSEKIIDYANTNDINLIVIPSHGRTGISRFLLGSVAERVVRLAHCPVLVLRRSD